MQRRREYVASVTDYFCDKCGEQIFDHRCTCTQCGSDFCERCRCSFDATKACEFCPEELQELQRKLDALWTKANQDASVLWEKREKVQSRLQEQQRLTAAERGICDVLLKAKEE